MKTLEVIQGLPSPDPLNIQMFVERSGFAHQVIITVTQADGQKQQVYNGRVRAGDFISPIPCVLDNSKVAPSSQGIL